MRWVDYIFNVFWLRDMEYRDLVASKRPYGLWDLVASKRLYDICHFVPRGEQRVIEEGHKSSIELSRTLGDGNH